MIDKEVSAIKTGAKEIEKTLQDFLTQLNENAEILPEAEDALQDEFDHMRLEMDEDIFEENKGEEANEPQRALTDPSFERNRLNPQYYEPY